MEHIFYHEVCGIHENQFINVQMEDVEVEMEDTESELEDTESGWEYSFSDNILDSVKFSNVTLKVTMGKLNKFIHCDTKGLKMYF